MTISARQLEEWVAYYEVEKRGDDRADALTALILWQNVNKDVTSLDDVGKAIWQAVSPPIDFADVSQRKKEAKKERRKKAKKKMAANLAIAKAVQDGGELNRQMERPSNA